MSNLDSCSLVVTVGRGVLEKLYSIFGLFLPLFSILGLFRPRFSILFSGYSGLDSLFYYWGIPPSMIGLFRPRLAIPALLTSGYSGLDWVFLPFLTSSYSGFDSIASRWNSLPEMIKPPNDKIRHKSSKVRRVIYLLVVACGTVARTYPHADCLLSFQMQSPKVGNRKGWILINY